MAVIGRPKKIGLDFFPEVVDPDEDFNYIDSRFEEGYKVVRKLWRKIYKNGYFCEWNERTLYTFASEIKVPAEKINEILEECFKIDLFSRKMHITYGILTSSGVQWRWRLISINSKRMITEVDPRYNLLKKKGKKNGGNPEESQLKKEESTLSSGIKSDAKNSSHGTVTEQPLSSGGKSVSSGIIPVLMQQSKTNTKGNTLKSITLGEEKILGEGGKNTGASDEKKIAPARNSIWDACVRVWIKFNVEKFGDEPTFYPAKGERKGPNPGKLKSIVDRLQVRAEKRMIPWTEEHATKTLREFFDQAYSDPWLAKTFLLKNIEQKYDAIILKMIEVVTNKGNKAPVEEKDIQYLYERYREGKLTPKIFDETHYQFINKNVSLEIGDDLLKAARERRIKNLEGTNDGPSLRLLRSYLDNLENEFTEQDRPKVLTIAMKLRVVDYFKERASQGAEKWL